MSPPITRVHNSILIPGEGEHVVDRDTQELNRFELQTLARMHEIAAKFELSIVCKRCDHAFTGKNNDSVQQPAIECRCRVLRYLG